MDSVFITNLTREKNYSLLDSGSPAMHSISSSPSGQSFWLSHTNCGGIQLIFWLDKRQTEISELKQQQKTWMTHTYKEILLSLPFVTLKTIRLTWTIETFVGLVRAIWYAIAYFRWIRYSVNGKRKN